MNFTYLLLYGILIFLTGCRINDFQYEIKDCPIESVKVIIVGWYSDSFWFVKRNQSFGYKYIVLYKNKEVSISENDFYFVYQCVTKIDNQYDIHIYQKMNQMCNNDGERLSHLQTTRFYISLYKDSQNKQYDWNCFNMEYLPYPQKQPFQNFLLILSKIEKL